MKPSLILAAGALALLAAPFKLAAKLGSFIVAPGNYGYAGVSYPEISGSTKAQILGVSPEGEETKWEMDIIQASQQNSPFADNMTGPPGSGKPLISKGLTKTVAGQSIVISTVESFGAPGVQGAADRVGQEEQVKPGDFLLKTSIWWCGAGITNTGLTQTVIGQTWSPLAKQLIARNLARKQNNDALFSLRNSAYSSTTPLPNVVFPNGKSIDSLGTADTYSSGLIVSAAGRLKDIGAVPMNVRPNPDSATSMPPPIQKYMQFTTDANARPIFTDSAYLEGLMLAQERGDKNPLFTGEYQMWQNNIIYPWVNVIHGGYGPIGSAIQPEALVGIAIVAKGTSTSLSAGIQGGGTAAGAAATPYRNYFEAFSRFTYTPINGVTSSFTPRVSVGYFIVIANGGADAGKVSFFSYTTNTPAVASTSANIITGLVRLGSTTAGDYATTVGNVTWGTAPWTTTANGAGFLGLSEGVIPEGSHIYETNSYGVPIAYGFGLGEMALVCGYGMVPVPGSGGSSFKTAAMRTVYEAPHSQAFAEGLQVAWGCSAFTRPDGLAQNYVLECFARQLSGIPSITPP